MKKILFVLLFCVLDSTKCWAIAPMNRIHETLCSTWIITFLISLFSVMLFSFLCIFKKTRAKAKLLSKISLMIFALINLYQLLKNYDNHILHNIDICFICVFTLMFLFLIHNLVGKKEKRRQLNRLTKTIILLLTTTAAFILSFHGYFLGLKIKHKIETKIEFNNLISKGPKYKECLACYSLGLVNNYNPWTSTCSIVDGDPDPFCAEDSIDCGPKSKDITIPDEVKEYTRFGVDTCKKVIEKWENTQNQ